MLSWRARSEVYIPRLFLALSAKHPFFHALQEFNLILPLTSPSRHEIQKQLSSFHVVMGQNPGTRMVP